jgi:small conductance mechanosensitive channel
MVARQVHLQRLGKLVFFALKATALATAAYVIALIWGVDLIAWAASKAGQNVIHTFFRLLLLLAGAVFGNELARSIVNFGLARLAQQTSDPRRAGQIHTLGPLLRGLAQSMVITISTLMILGEIGVQIGPLIAGAGIVGIAVGFGAQTLVKDFLTGMFLVIEDVVSLGDIVTIGGFGGLVEKMTLRTIHLRDTDGTLHIFPYSEAQVVHNLTKTFGYYVFDLQVSYESDVDHALRVMADVGSQLQRDESFRDKILCPIEVMGVDGFADSGVKLKARFKTRPAERWKVGREYNRRIKLAFDAAGISIPYPHVHVVPKIDEFAMLAQRLAHQGNGAALLATDGGLMRTHAKPEDSRAAASA